MARASRCDVDYNLWLWLFEFNFVYTKALRQGQQSTKIVGNFVVLYLRLGLPASWLTGEDIAPRLIEIAQGCFATPGVKTDAENSIRIGRSHGCSSHYLARLPPCVGMGR